MAVPDEGHLVNTALELLDNETFWAGIVFENLQSNSSHPPPYIRYKIRMDIDEVERTDDDMERYKKKKSMITLSTPTVPVAPLKG